VPDPANPGKTIAFHPLESNYYEFTRYDKSTGVTYGWAPLPGYAAPGSSTLRQSAMTRRPGRHIGPTGSPIGTVTGTGTLGRGPER